MSERDCLDEYLELQGNNHHREVPVGNIYMKEWEDIPQGYQGTASLSIDALYEDTKDKRVSVIEAKEELNKKALGQVIFYSYLFQIERGIVREKRTGKKSEYDRYEQHIKNKSGRYVAMPSINEVDHSVVACGLGKQDESLLLACDELNIDVNYKESGNWRRFDAEIPKLEESISSSTLARESSESLDSSQEDELGKEFVGTMSSVLNITDIDVYKEVPLGKERFGDRAPVCDLILKMDDYWLVAEIKSSTTDTSSSDFLKAFGQVTVYSVLFAQLTDISEDRIVPAIVQHPVLLAADGYRQARYDEDYTQMFNDAVQNMARPFIFGPGETVSKS